MGLDLSQAFTPSSGQAPEMGHVPSSSSTTASKENSSRVMQQQSKSLPNGLRDVVFDAEPNSTFQNFNSSIYLSKRGNEINNFCGGLQEGFVAYHADKHDEDTNPNGIVNLGTSENKLCFDLLCKRLTQKDMCYIDPQLLQYSDWKGHQFLREEVGRFLTYHCKAPAPLKPENVSIGLSIKAMILMNPHNPLGDSYSGAEMTEFLEFAKRYKLHVIVDEVYMLSVFGDACSFQSVLSLQRLPDPQRTHVMWGISKDLAASGLRVSTLYTANMDIISALGQLSYFHALPGPTQHAVAQLLKDRDWINQVFLPTNRARLKTAHKYIADELTAMGIPFLNRSAGLFIWADFRKYLKSPTFEEEIKLWRQLLENKVLISNGKEFFCCEPGWFRIVFSDKTYRIQLGEITDALF
uniref:1-aminocyclopropane-1-carboxylate synthase-like protein 1 n=1 Tax=Callorhinchus milii TaxID=7868 RepID=A0A4W3JHJ7_CALMI